MRNSNLTSGMSSTKEDWEAIEEQRKWTMPSAPWYKKLWLVRHIRAVVRLYRMQKLVANGKPGYMGNVAKLYWECHGIWLGKETKP